MSVNQLEPKAGASSPKGDQALLELLKDKGLLKPEEIQIALAEQKVTGDRLAVVLQRNGFMSRAKLIQTLAEYAPEELQGERFYSSVAPPDVLLQTRTAILAETEDSVFLATLGPEHPVREALAPLYAPKVLKFLAAAPERVTQYLGDISRLYGENQSLMERLLREALLHGDSDVHILPKYSSFSVFSRHLGVLRHVYEGNKEDYSTLVARIKDLSRMDIAERRLPMDGSFQIEHNGRLVDLRVATVPVVDGEKVVIRLLDPDRVQPTLDGLGITRVEEWRRGVARPDGMCLICGPTGSGKSTTLNASLRELNRFERSIYTEEDPVEYQIPYIAQVNVNEVVGLTFARGIRAFMRADPDVIVTGELRDQETAQNNVKAADTGHMAIGTLHAGSVLGAFHRLRDLGIHYSEVKHVMRSVLAQRLVRTLCKHCHGAGCNHCLQTGYGNRSVVSECVYFSNEEEVERAIAGERWWPSMMEDAVQKVREGLTDRREVIRVFGPEAAEYMDAHGVQDKEY